MHGEGTGQPDRWQTRRGDSLGTFAGGFRVHSVAGGYVFWTKRRFVPAPNRFAAVVLLAEPEDPDVYLVPSTEWRSAKPPLTDRPNIDKRSEPEYGLSLARSSLPALQRYAWSGKSGNAYFR
jgi:hypothetical protein